MGVPGLWEVLRPAARTQSLSQLAVTQGFEGNTGGHRGFRVGIDASIWFFHAQVFNGKAFNKGDVGENPEIRTLFFRCAKLMSLPLLPLFVFDGPQRPKWKRGKRISKHKDSWLVQGMQNIIQAFGYEYVHAPGEAEAELAYLNRIGVIDAVLTDDVDTFLFGATMIIRNPSATLSGNRANPIKNSEGRDDGNHVNCYTADDLRTHSEIKLTQGGLILIGLMRGGDYHQAGIQGVGVTIARALAECGFGDQLVEAVRTLKGDALETFLDQWRANIVHELRTNSRGIIGKKHAKLASTFPADFPDLKVVDAYVNPVVSEKHGVFHDIEWRREPDLSLLAKLCEQHFEWGYLEAILKRFRTIVWPGMVCRIIRRSVLLADDAAAAAEKRRTVGATPTKARAALAQGTPSKMITQYFSQLDINSPVHRPFDAPDAAPLIAKIHSERKHASTDGLREFRLEIAPLQLAKLAEQGVLGTRSKPEANPYLEDDDEDDEDEDEGQGGKKKKARKPSEPVAPDAIMRVRMPACMVELVEPRLVHEYEDVQERKRLKKEGKGGAAAPRQRKATAGDAKPKAAARKPAASKAKKLASAYFSDSDAGGASGDDSDNAGDSAIENIPIMKTQKKTGTMEAPALPPINATRLFARPADPVRPPSAASRASSASSTSTTGRSKASSSASTAPSSASASAAMPAATTKFKSKTAMVADLFAPSPEKPSAAKGKVKASVDMDAFFSDGEAPLAAPARKPKTQAKPKAPAKTKTAPAEQKKLPLFLPCSSDEEAIRAAAGRRRSDSDGGLSDALRKSPRKSRLQTSPRAQRRVEPLRLGRSAARSDSDSEREPLAITKLQPLKPAQVQKPKPRPAAVAADVIIISSSEDERPASAWPKKPAAAREVIDLT